MVSGTAAKSRPKSAAMRAKISATMSGRSLSDDHRAALSRHVFTDEHKARLSEANARRKASGWTHSLDARARIAEAAAKNWASGLWGNDPTNLEVALYGLLEGANFEFEQQVRFGRYVVDAWLPQERLVFEADGWFWHQDKEKEVRRDAYLMNHGVLAVVHFSDEDLLCL